MWFPFLSIILICQPYRQVTIKLQFCHLHNSTKSQAFHKIMWYTSLHIANAWKILLAKCVLLCYAEFIINQIYRRWTSLWQIKELIQPSIPRCPIRKNITQNTNLPKMFTHILCERLTCPILTRQIAGSFFILLQMRWHNENC